MREERDGNKQNKRSQVKEGGMAVGRAAGGTVEDRNFGCTVEEI